ncbi:MAG TPA: DUF898 family protein [Hyphomicrobium sp.]|nr:DUF898 family protein [Hyphomicrobium sp.]
MTVAWRIAEAQFRTQPAAQVQFSDGFMRGTKGAGMNTLITDDRAAAREPIDISFHSDSSAIVGLGAINGILKVLTLGLYSFWAKTELRRKIWSATRLNGEPLGYTGTGKELFLGFLIVFGLVVLPVLLAGVAVSLMFPGDQTALAIFQGFLYLLFFLLVGNAMYRAQRYRLSRSEWRGIRGSLAGSPGRYGWAYFWTLAMPFAFIALLAGVFAYATGPAVGGVLMVAGLLAVLWVLPWRANYLRAKITRDMRFGDRPLSYTGTARPLYKRYLFAWLGNALIFATAIATTALYVMQSGLYDRQIARLPPQPSEILPIAGIWILAVIASAVVTAWYRAKQINHFAGSTHFEGATFRGEATGGSLMWLVLSNWIISALGLVAGALLAGVLVYLFAPSAAAIGLQPQLQPFNLLALLIAVPPIIVLTTLAATIAQFRAARYLMTRLKLDGPVNLGLIMQSQNRMPKRGEGLAQVFDLDAF